jgi:hypothetical protein
MVPGETMLRVASVRDEATIDEVRNTLDELGIDYEHIRSEPGEDVYPQTAYFYVPDDAAEDVDAVMQRLSEDMGFEAEVL